MDQDDTFETSALGSTTSSSFIHMKGKIAKVTGYIVSIPESDSYTAVLCLARISSIDEIIVGCRIKVRVSSVPRKVEALTLTVERRPSIIHEMRVGDILIAPNDTVFNVWLIACLVWVAGVVRIDSCATFSTKRTHC